MSSSAQHGDPLGEAKVSPSEGPPPEPTPSPPYGTIDPEPDDPEANEPEAQLGPAPEVVGRARIHDDVRARLFGDVPPAQASPTTPGVPPASQAPDPDLPVRQIGRFRVLEPLGRGGMGVVYRAYDPELDRPVAIKLLRADVHGLGGQDAQARLLREAQAMARLSDPNVIVVHEVGTMGDRVFVAMEYVDGPTLRTWLQTPRPRSEILRVFVAAGDGLAAAHRAGLVHRDFKPDNVLIDPEGRVRVLDFGLARSLGDAPNEATIPAPERPELDSLHTPLTRTGAVMGTPAYMSPEQMLGHPADARSDQFSFCVALWEGLCGVRPFAGTTMAALSMNVVRGRLRDPPANVRVPGRLWAAIRRGLSVDPDARYARMEDLLEPLRAPPARGWRRGLLVLTVGAVASLATLAVRGTDASEACAGLEDRLVGLWDESRRTEVTAAIEGTGRSFAPPVARTTVAMLDDYAARWLDLAEEACGAALVAQEPDEADRRRDCLEQRRVELGALVDALSEADEGMVHAAVNATADLTPPGACSDPRRLAELRVEEDPAVREHLAQARAQLARAKAKGALGRYDEAIDAASAVIEQAQGRESSALEAMGQMIRGTYRERAGDSAGAEQDLRRAVELAQAGGDPSTRAQAMVRLVWVVGHDRSRYPQARALGIQAGAVLELIGAPPLLHADLDNNLGTICRVAGALDEALEHHQRALQRRREVLGDDHPDVGRSLTNIGNVLSAQGRLTEAEDHLRRGLAHAERTLGPEHPTVAGGLYSLAYGLDKQARPHEALTTLRRALTIYERAFGADHPSSLNARFSLAKIAQTVDQHRPARALLLEGLARRERTLGPDDPRLRGWLVALGTSEAHLGHRDAAVHLGRALTIMEAQGMDELRLAQPRFALARVLKARDPARARTLATTALTAVHGAEAGEDPNHAAAELRREIEAWLTSSPP
ncbi:MAG: serine/threonine-protein kinase [Myxococcota bacterium]